MRPKRSRLDWTLEAIAFGALALLLYLLAANWANLPLRPARLGLPGMPAPWSARTALGVMGALGVLGYVGMTLATNYEKLIQIPETLDRAAPHLRQMIFSMGIMLKAVLMAVSLYLVWVLVNLAQGRTAGFGRPYITGMVFVVLAPFALYIVKLRRGR